jgi:dihydroorotate dehydrogenase electron transfer subunit
MKREKLSILENVCIAPDVFKMTLEGDVSSIIAPGQFINILIDGLYLRRPISVCDCDDGTLTVIYKVVGKGTRALSEMGKGQVLDCLLGLGNGYTIHNSGSAFVVGGGVGVPPLYMLTKKLIAEGKKVVAVLGFNKKEEIFLAEEFEKLGATVYISTVDGSVGTKGFVTDVLKEHIGDAQYVYTCGPEPMLKAVYDAVDCDGQFSFEERMGCGFGACMGCSCKTKYGYKRICKDGPVLYKEEIVW